MGKLLQSFLIASSTILCFSDAPAAGNHLAANSALSVPGLNYVPVSADARLSIYEKESLKFGPGRPADRAFIRSVMGEALRREAGPETLKTEPRPEDSFRISYVDVNGDGRPDMFVTYEAPGWCAAGGCGIELFIAQPDGSWKSVMDDQMDYVRVIKHRTRGYNDILLLSHTVGEVQKSLHQWDGRKYVTTLDQIGNKIYRERQPRQG